MIYSFKNYRFLLIMLFAVVFVCISCSGDPDDSQPGIEYKGSFSGDGTGFIGRASSIAADDSNIYVGDTGNGEVKVYTKDGEFLNSFGRRGRGPGEFTGLLQISVRDDELIIHDVSQQRVHFYSKTGDYRDSFMLEERHSTPFYYFNDQLVAGAEAIGLMSSESTNELFRVYSKGGESVGSFGDMPYEDDELPALLRRFSVELVEDELRVYFTFLGLYQIYNIESGALKYQIDLLKVDSPIQFTDIRSQLIRPEGAEIGSPEELIGYGFESSGDDIYLYSDVGDSLHVHRLKVVAEDAEYLAGYSYPKTSDRIIYGILDMEYDPTQEAFLILENESVNGFTVSKYKPIKD